MISEASASWSTTGLGDSGTRLNYGGAHTESATVAESLRGYIYEVQEEATDCGPGRRLAVYTTGCPMRCMFCSRPELMCHTLARFAPVSEMREQMVAYRERLGTRDTGVTVSGGEPLVQPKFTAGVLAAARALGFHTCLDTTGYFGNKVQRAMLEEIDLVILNLKSFQPDNYRKVTGVDIQASLHFARQMARLGQPMWVRFVLVPGLTDDPANIAGMAEFLAELGNVERVEVLPFSKHGEHRWKELRKTYRLYQTPEPLQEEMERVRLVFELCGLEVS